MNGEIIEYNEKRFIKPKEQEEIEMPNYTLNLDEYEQDTKSWTHFTIGFILVGLGIFLMWVNSLAGMYSSSGAPLMILLVVVVAVMGFSIPYHNARISMLRHLSLIGVELYSERNYKKLKEVKNLIDKYSEEEYSENSIPCY